MGKAPISSADSKTGKEGEEKQEKQEKQEKKKEPKFHYVSNPCKAMRVMPNCVVVPKSYEGTEQRYQPITSKPSGIVMLYDTTKDVDDEDVIEVGQFGRPK